MVLSSEGFSFFQIGSTPPISSPGAATESDRSVTAVDHSSEAAKGQSRRDSFASIMGAMTIGAAMLSSPAPASAVPDCMKDCTKNCLQIAPQVSLIRSYHHNEERARRIA